MNNNNLKNAIRLFGMSSLQIDSSIKAIEREHKLALSPGNGSGLFGDKEFYPQFDLSVRTNAKKMSRYYELFFCLENSLRQIIREKLSKKFGEEDWWDKIVPKKIRDDVSERIQRDLDSSFALRSEDNLDFANFGELKTILEKQWESFDDIFTSKRALIKVLVALNTLRGPIAHCCDLAEDEEKRLEITIRDWFRLMS